MAKTKPKAKVSVNSKDIAARYIGSCLARLGRGDTFEDCLDFLESKALKAFPSATKDALKNCRGRWFEILLVLASNLIISDKDRLFLKLGTANEHSIFDVFSDLSEITPPPNFTINLSIPDMILIDASASRPLLEWKKKLSTLNPEQDGTEIVELILSAHKTITATKIHTKYCKAFCSIKTSLRPDRKYQAMYEAESIRAIQKRIPEWKAKYYMVGPLEANATKEILDSNLSLIALGDNHQSPYKTVDQIFIVNNLPGLKDFVQVCLAL